MAIEPPLSLATGYCVVFHQNATSLIIIGHSSRFTLRDRHDRDDMGVEAIPRRNPNVTSAIAKAYPSDSSEQFSTAGRSVKTGLVGITL